MKIPRGTIPVVNVETQTEGYILLDSPEWRALLEWVKLHGLDPEKMLASGGVTRDALDCCIRYTTFVYDDDGRRRLDPDGPGTLLLVPGVEQGEAPPFPFPDLVQAQLRPMPAVAP